MDKKKALKVAGAVAAGLATAGAVTAGVTMHRKKKEQQRLLADALTNEYMDNEMNMYGTEMEEEKEKIRKGK